MTRQPSFPPRARIDLRARRAFQAGVIDSVNRAFEKTASERHECPLCAGAIYAPADTDGERLDCSSCGAVLVTKRNICGFAVVELDAGVSEPPPSPALAERADWQRDVWAAIERDRGGRP